MRKLVILSLVLMMISLAGAEIVQKGKANLQIAPKQAKTFSLKKDETIQTQRIRITITITIYSDHIDISVSISWSRSRKSGKGSQSESDKLEKSITEQGDFSKTDLKQLAEKYYAQAVKDAEKQIVDNPA